MGTPSCHTPTTDDVPLSRGFGMSVWRVTMSGHHERSHIQGRPLTCAVKPEAWPSTPRSCTASAPSPVSNFSLTVAMAGMGETSAAAGLGPDRSVPRAVLAVRTESGRSQEGWLSPLGRLLASSVVLPVERICLRLENRSVSSLCLRELES